MGEVSTAKWQSVPLSIDGNSSDWGSNIRFFNSDSRIQYEFRNDDKNLFLIIKSTDQAMQRQMAMAGIKLKLKIKTDPKMTTTMDFSKHKAGMLASGNSGQRRMRGQRNHQIQTIQDDGQNQTNSLDEMAMKPEFMRKDSMFIEGFLFAKNAIVSDNITSNTIIFSKNKRNLKDPKTSNNGSVYEICIPLREFFGDNYSMEKISTIPFQLQVQVNGTTQSSSGGGRTRGRMGGRMGGSGGGGMEGPGGGGMSEPGGGEMGSGEMGERPEMPDGEMGEQDSMSQKTFNANFLLSAQQ